MSDIKLPQIEVNINRSYDLPTPENQWKQVNPSCLLAYLGIKGYGINAIPTQEDVTIRKMAIPLLGYYDIFKNYYANTQEENFYTIGATSAIDKVIVTQNYKYKDKHSPIVQTGNNRNKSSDKPPKEEY